MPFFPAQGLLYPQSIAAGALIITREMNVTNIDINATSFDFKLPLFDSNLGRLINVEVTQLLSLQNPASFPATIAFMGGSTSTSDSWTINPAVSGAPAVMNGPAAFTMPEATGTFFATPSGSPVTYTASPSVGNINVNLVLSEGEGIGMAEFSAVGGGSMTVTITLNQAHNLTPPDFVIAFPDAQFWNYICTVQYYYLPA